SDQHSQIQPSQLTARTNNRYAIIGPRGPATWAHGHRPAFALAFVGRACERPCCAHLYNCIRSPLFVRPCLGCTRSPPTLSPPPGWSNFTRKPLGLLHLLPLLPRPQLLPVLCCYLPASVIIYSCSLPLQPALGLGNRVLLKNTGNRV